MSSYQMTQVSVVTTVYQGESYFDRAKSSILEQTYDNYEWILVEDGSSDRTPELLEELDQKYSRAKIYFPGRLGRAAALNFGINKAEGKYIAIHDFDDISYPERLEKQVNYLESNTNVGVAGSYYVLVNQIRNERFVRKPPTADEDIRRAFAQNIPFAHTLTMFRKEAWDAVDGYPLIDNLIDLGLWLELASETDWKFANVDDVLGEHFVHDESFWHRNFEYAKRQRDLSRLQARAIRNLNLPKWMYAYAAGRLVYPYLPHSVKRIVRNMVGSSEEENI